MIFLSPRATFHCRFAITILSMVSIFLLRVISTPLGFVFSYSWLYTYPIWMIKNGLRGVGPYPTWFNEVSDAFFSVPAWLFVKISHIIYPNQPAEWPLFSIPPGYTALYFIITKAIFIITIGVFIYKYRTSMKTIDIVEKFLYNQQSVSNAQKVPLCRHHDNHEALE